MRPALTSLRVRDWLDFLIDTGGMSDFEAQSFLARRYMLLCVKATVPKNVKRWLAENAPGPQYDGEHAKSERLCHSCDDGEYLLCWYEPKICHALDRTAWVDS